MAGRRKYRFVGRFTTKSGTACYVWISRVPGDSRVEEISCSVDYFWGRNGN